MSVALATQLRQVLFFAAVGAALGLWYDLLRLMRRGAVFTAVGDGLFALGVLLALFGTGQRAAEGAFYLYMAAAAALGFFLWRRFASAPVRRRFAALGQRLAASFLAVGAKKAMLWLKKLAVSLFSSAAKWVTIAYAAHRARGRRQTAYEAAQGKHPDPARHRGAAGLRRRAHRADAGKAGRGIPDAKRAGRAGGGA